jgi:hypothetical protein
MSCVSRHRSDNENFIRRIATVVEIEMISIGVPRRLFSSVILVPACRLGSDASGSERGAPCASSFWSGQFFTNVFSYTLVGPYFRVRRISLDPAHDVELANRPRL